MSVPGVMAGGMTEAMVDSLSTTADACSTGANAAGHAAHLEDIPTEATDWDVTARGAATLAATLAAQRADAETFKLLATLRTDAAVGTVDDWEWTGPTENFSAWCRRFG
jgi:hypothetical protein